VLADAYIRALGENKSVGRIFLERPARYEREDSTVENAGGGTT